jgi:hypothetical protein
MPTRAHRARMRPLLLLPACALLIATSGCIGWKWVPPPAPAPDGTPARFTIARVTLANGAVQELHDVQVTADSVTGKRVTDGGRWYRASLPRAEVTVVERQSVNLLATVLIAVAAGAVWLYAWLLSNVG